MFLRMILDSTEKYSAENIENGSGLKHVPSAYSRGMHMISSNMTSLTRRYALRVFILSATLVYTSSKLTASCTCCYA